MQVLARIRVSIKSPGSLGEMSGFGSAKGDLNLSWSIEKLWIPQPKRVLGHCRQRLSKDKGAPQVEYWRVCAGATVCGEGWQICWHGAHSETRLLLYTEKIKHW